MYYKKMSGLIRTAVVFSFFGLSMASCKRNDSPVPGEAVKDYHQAAITQFINVGETKIAYRVLGDTTKMPLVMVSALGSSMDDWDPAITNGFASKNKVIIFDLPGVGSSTGNAPDNIADMAKGVAAFIKALGYGKVNLMGFSMGAFITQQITLTEPELVNRIILTGTGPKGSAGLSNLPTLLAGAAGLSEEESFLKFGFTASWVSISAGKAAFERIHKRTVNRDTEISDESAGAEVKAVLGWAQPYPEALNELKTIKQPVLIAQGEQDIPVPVINAVNMSKSIPHAKLIVYPDAGHAAIYPYPQEFVPAALAFLSE